MPSSADIPAMYLPYTWPGGQRRRPAPQRADAGTLARLVLFARTRNKTTRLRYTPGGDISRGAEGMGSNHRRLSRRFYSPSLLPEADAADQRVRRSRRDSAPAPSATRPWTLNFGGVRATDKGEMHGRGR
jgi:hypothetical protein